MKKWQELSLNALMNFSVAIMAACVLRVLFDTQSVVTSITSFVFGAYILFATTLIAKNIEERKK